MEGFHSLEIQDIFPIDQSKLHIIGDDAEASRNCKEIVTTKARYNSRRVRVKFLPENRTKEFLRETSLLLEAQHETIAALIGASKGPPMIIVTEGGRTLRDYLRNKRETQSDLVLSSSLLMSIDIAKAMERLHEMGIVHRDLKAENILVSKELQIKLTGFGFARKKAADMTADSGSICCRAPEVFEEAGKQTMRYDEKADVFSFSWLLWELLMNKNPLEELDTDVKIRSAFLITDWRPEEDLPVEELCSLVSSCWDEKPVNRPNFTAIIQTLSEALQRLDPTLSSPSRMLKHNKYEEDEESSWQNRQLYDRPEPRADQPGGLFDYEIVDSDNVKIIGQIFQGDSRIIDLGLYHSHKVALKDTDLEEVEMLSRAQHEGVVKLYGACVRTRPVRMIMEYMAGGSLKDYLVSIRPNLLDLGYCLRIALAISEVMQHLHELGITHRDLKPANFLLSEDKQTVKIADFDVATLDREMGGGEVGTDLWMAPEVSPRIREYTGKEFYNSKVDIFSFGMVLWELLENRNPLDAIEGIKANASVSEKLLAIKIGHQRPVRKRREVPERLGDLIRSCLEYAPEDRPEFSDITVELQGVLEILKNAADRG